MEKFLQFLFDYRMVIIYVLSIVFGAVMNFKGFKEKVMSLVYVAEEKGSKAVFENGQEKEDFVYAEISKLCPKVVAFLGEPATRGIIAYLIKKAKDLIDDGKLNDSVQ